MTLLDSSSTVQDSSSTHSLARSDNLLDSTHSLVRNDNLLELLEVGHVPVGHVPLDLDLQQSTAPPDVYQQAMAAIRQHDHWLSSSNVPRICSSELQLGDIIGTGGFAAVYKARWLETDVAVKVLKKILGREDDGAKVRRALQKEACVLAQFRHPHISTFFGVSDLHETCAIVMELLEGGSLRGLLSRAASPQLASSSSSSQRRPDEQSHANRAESRVAESTARGAAQGHGMVISDGAALGAGFLCRITAEAASGLAYLHRNDYMHRDVKADNVMLNAMLRAKVTDFGLAAVCSAAGVEATSADDRGGGGVSFDRGGSDEGRAPSHSGLLSERSLTTVGHGTLRYMAPEVLRAARQLDGARATGADCGYAKECDIYSFGLMLWEMMHTETVFAESPGFAAAIRASFHHERPTIALSPDRAPFAELIDTCSQLEPRMRPKIEEVTDALWSILRTPQMQASLAVPSWAFDDTLGTPTPEPEQARCPDSQGQRSSPPMGLSSPPMGWLPSEISGDVL